MKYDKSVGTMATTMEGSATTMSAGLVKMESTSTKTTNTFTTMAQQLQFADKSVAAFGVSLSPAINVLQEFGQVAGKTTGDLGLLGTATSAFAVGLASFKATQFVLEITGAGVALDALYKELFSFLTIGQEITAI